MFAGFLRTIRIVSGIERMLCCLVCVYVSKECKRIFGSEIKCLFYLEN